jgi:outer membrane protein assembly factor BamB
MDLDTGAFSQLGTTGLLLSGLGVANGKIYGGATNGNTLYQVNPSDGTLTPVGNGQISYYDTGSTTSVLSEKYA